MEFLIRPLDSRYTCRIVRPTIQAADDFSVKLTLGLVGRACSCAALARCWVGSGFRPEQISAGGNLSVEAREGCRHVTPKKDCEC